MGEGASFFFLLCWKVKQETYLYRISMDTKWSLPFLWKKRRLRNRDRQRVGRLEDELKIRKHIHEHIVTHTMCVYIKQKKKLKWFTVPSVPQSRWWPSSTTLPIGTWGGVGWFLGPVSHLAPAMNIHKTHPTKGPVLEGKKKGLAHSVNGVRQTANTNKTIETRFGVYSP